MVSDGKGGSSRGEKRCGVGESEDGEKVVRERLQPRESRESFRLIGTRRLFGAKGGQGDKGELVGRPHSKQGLAFEQREDCCAQWKVPIA